VNINVNIQIGISDQLNRNHEEDNVKIDLWFNKNVAPFMTSERKMPRLRKLVD